MYLHFCHHYQQQHLIPYKRNRFSVKYYNYSIFPFSSYTIPFYSPSSPSSFLTPSSSSSFESFSFLQEKHIKFYRKKEIIIFWYINSMDFISWGCYLVDFPRTKSFHFFFCYFSYYLINFYYILFELLFISTRSSHTPTESPCTHTHRTYTTSELVRVECSV